MKEATLFLYNILNINKRFLCSRGQTDAQKILLVAAFYKSMLNITHE